MNRVTIALLFQTFYLTFFISSQELHGKKEEILHKKLDNLPGPFIMNYYITTTPTPPTRNENSSFTEGKQGDKLMAERRQENQAAFGGDVDEGEYPVDVTKADLEKLRLPYWKGGEKVFHMITKAYKLPKHARTVHTRPTYKYTYNQKPGDKYYNFKINSINYYRECSQDCPRIYTDYFGPVCGIRLDTDYWKNSYMNFNNICELDYENCKQDTHRPMWKVAHRGKCPLQFQEEYRMVWFNITRNSYRWERLSVGNRLVDRAKLFLAKVLTTPKMVKK